MIQELFRTYKKIILLLLLAMCALLFLFFYHRKNERAIADTSKWEEIKKNNGETYYTFETEYLKGTLSFGNMGVVSKDKVLPVILTASCKKKQFDGIIQINLPGEYGKGIAYQAAISCKKGIVTKKTLEVPQLGNASGFIFRIADPFENVLFSRAVPVRKTEENMEEYTIGILSDDYSLLSYLDNISVQIEDTNYVSRLVQISPSFDSDVSKLHALSVLIIDSFDTARLSNIQIATLNQWIKEGGTVLLGGGADCEKTISAFQEKYAIKVGDIDSRLVNTKDKQSEYGGVSIEYSELTFDNSKNWSDGAWTDPVTSYSKQVEDGQIICMTFSFLDNAFIQWVKRDSATKMLMEELLSNQVKENKKKEQADWYLQKALYAFEGSQSPNIFYYGLFFLIYLLCLGTLVYDVLRGMERREYIWYMIPVASLIFTALVGVRAISNNVNSESFSGSIQIKDSEKKKDEVYLFYQSKDGKKRSMSINALYNTIEPVGYVYSTNISNQQSTPVDYVVNDTKHGKEIDISESVPGVSQLMKITADTEEDMNAETGNFKVKITGDENRFRGSIENTSDVAYERILLIRGTQYTVLSDVKKHSTNKIMGSDVQLWNEEYTSKFMANQNASNDVLSYLLSYLAQHYISEENKLNQLIVIGITEDKNTQLFTDENVVQKSLNAEISRYKILTDQYQEKDRK